MSVRKSYFNQQPGKSHSGFGFYRYIHDQNREIRFQSKPGNPIMNKCIRDSDFNQNRDIRFQPKPGKDFIDRWSVARHSVPYPVPYTRSPLQDSRLLGPRPWKILATTYEQKGS